MQHDDELANRLPTANPNHQTNRTIIYLLIGVLCFLAIAIVLSVTAIWMVLSAREPLTETPNGSSLGASELQNTTPDTKSSIPNSKLAGAAVVEINPLYAALRDRDLSYRWKNGEQYSYHFDVSIGDDRQRRLGGNFTLDIGTTELLNEDPVSTGTAFSVVAPDYLMTCAHVAKYAKRIKVFAEGRELYAKIIDVDDQRDLALLKVENGSFSPLPFASGDQVGLAEQVMAFGFPMTDVLGKGVKASTGIISGISDVEDGKQLSIDGAVNPGNSGGPIVNYQGQVIGVASAKLRGTDVSPVGFASPVNAVVQLLKRNGLVPTTQPGGSSMQPKDIAAKVTPSVFLVESHGWADDRLTKVTFHANYNDSRYSNSTVIVNGVRQVGLRANGSFQVSKLGEIRKSSGKGNLPYMMGRIGTLPIEPLDIVSKSKWSRDQSYLIKQQETQSFFPSSRLGLNRRLGFPFFAPPKTADESGVVAKEKIEHEIIDQQSDVLTIKKTYSLRTPEDVGAQQLAIEGEGQWTFDLKRGVPTSLNEKLSYQEKHLEPVPIVIGVEERDADEVREEQAKAALEAAEKRKADEKERTIPNPELVMELHDRIQSSKNEAECWPLVDRLSRIAVVQEKRPQMLDLFQDLALKQSFLRDRAIAALMHWADASSANLIRDLCNAPQLKSQRRELLDWIADQKDEQDIELFIKNLGEISASRTCVNALIGFGAKSEDAVLKALEDSDSVFRYGDLLDVLSKVGTSKSLDRLKKLASERDSMFSVRAEITRRAIQRRSSL